MNFSQFSICVREKFLIRGAIIIAIRDFVRASLPREYASVAKADEVLKAYDELQSAGAHLPDAFLKIAKEIFEENPLALAS